MTRKILATAVLGMALAAGAPRAEARVVRYLGPHPIAPHLGKGLCHIEGPHLHAYEPHKTLLYVKQGDAHVFVGDPVEFEASTPRHAYYGHHPVFWAGRGGPKGPGPGHYCYLAGPHFHWYAPPPALALQFRPHGGALWYVGEHPKWYKPKHWRAAALAHHYGGVSLHVPWPVITVEPPSGWVGVAVSPGHLKVKGLFGPFGIFHPGKGHGHGHFKVEGHGHGHFKVKGHGHFKGRHGHGKGMGR